MSKRRAEQMKIYRVRGPIFLKANPKCQLGCGRDSAEVHHKARRLRGAFLDESTWLATCFVCHSYIEAHASWARANGFITDYPHLGS